MSKKFQNPETLRTKTRPPPPYTQKFASQSIPSPPFGNFFDKAEGKCQQQQFPPPILYMQHTRTQGIKHSHLIFGMYVWGSESCWKKGGRNDGIRSAAFTGEEGGEREEGIADNEKKVFPFLGRMGSGNRVLYVRESLESVFVCEISIEQKRGYFFSS